MICIHCFIWSSQRVSIGKITTDILELGKTEVQSSYVSKFRQLETKGTEIWIQADLTSEPTFSRQKLEDPELHKRIFWDMNSRVISACFPRSCSDEFD